MGIRIKTNIGDTIKRLEQEQKVLDTKLVDLFRQAGEQAVEIAKTEHTYQDRTGNLTNSMGYAVVMNGEIVASGGFGGGEGGSVGRAKVNELAGKYQAGTIALIVVAGMDYAELVERRGYDVLDSARLQLPNIVAYILQKL